VILERGTNRLHVGCAQSLVGSPSRARPSSHASRLTGRVRVSTLAGVPQKGDEVSTGPWRAVVVGAGPAGFYATDQLLAAGFEVDLIDLLPTPFGLVRSGVAPDHPKIKSVTRVYDKTAARPGFRFFGGVELGIDISRSELLEHYHAVVYAIGCADDNRLGIPGEDRPGSYPATKFVAWYNGHPHGVDEDFDLSARRAVVIGNGNVAADVARMLVLEPGELAVTDTADHAVDVLTSAAIEEVVLLGRRGPAQAAFTNPELRELGELTRADIDVDPAELELDPHSQSWLEEEADATARRNVDLLREFAQREPAGKSHRVSLRFLRSPIEVLGEGETGPVTGLRVVRNRIERDENGRLRAVPTDQIEEIECGLVLRSIGYRGRPVGDVPFDERRGLIRNVGGRVCDEESRSHRGEYVVGWIKRGPSGVIGTNKKDAADTVSKVIEDAAAGALNQPADPTAEGAEQCIRARVPSAISWEGWCAIDEHERRAGEPQSRPRVKIVRMQDLLEAAGAWLTQRR
jgi:ferredoxin/flavodoxin---NADP+ reductase